LERIYLCQEAAKRVLENETGWKNAGNAILALKEVNLLRVWERD